MSLKIDKCSMPSCQELTENGKRLCARHAASGKDLRIPAYVINLGLEKIYDTIRRQKQGFSVETILDILDPGYADRIDGVNCKNALAKLFRSLRANKFLLKKGHVNGFVVYELGEGWKQNYVFIDDEPPAAQENTTLNVVQLKKQFQFLSDKEIKPLVIENARVKKQVATLTEKVDNMEQQFITFLREQKEAIETLQNNVKALAKHIEGNNQTTEQVKLKEEIDLINQQIVSLSKNKQECPVAKLREHMHVLFGGKRSETKL